MRVDGNGFKVDRKYDLPVRAAWPVVLRSRTQVLAAGEAGNKVLTERIDRILDADGAEVMTVPVMGIFEIEDGKIAAWRDYFDTLKNSPPEEGDA